MKLYLKLSLIALLLVNISVSEASRFPKNPDISQTPGMLCDTPAEHRYPENVAYCGRDVDTYLKNSIIEKYDTLFGFEIKSMKRSDFKIDHLIPLCAGGANTEENLWPQHKSVYAITDPMEPVLCEKMKQGRLKQKEAVQMILKAKLNLELAPTIFRELKSI